LTYLCKEFSDYENDAYHLIPVDNDPLPVVQLDQRYYRVIADFEHRFADGVPQMRDCTHLTVEGDVTFVAGVSLRGNVTLRATTVAARLSPGEVTDGIHILS